MAQNSQLLKLQMRPVTDAKNANYGKYFAEVGNNETLSQRGFIDHLIHHGLSYPRSIIEGVVAQMTQCLPELIAHGVAVKFEGLGTFKPTIENVKGGIAYADLKDGGVDPKNLVAGVHIRFTPENAKLDKLTSRAFKDKCSLTVDQIIVAQRQGEGQQAVRMDAKYDYEQWKKLPADRDHGIIVIPTE